MATGIRLYEIATASGDDLENNEICNETTANATTGFKMWAGKDNDGNVTRWLAMDKNAQVVDLSVTGDITVLTGSITVDALSLSTLADYRILFGDFSQATTFKWQNSKLRIGSTDAPVNIVDVAVTSEDGTRVENTAPDATHPLRIFEKTSASPADNDGIGKIIHRGYDGNQSTPVKRDYVTREAVITDVSAISAKYTISVMRQGMPESYIFGPDDLTIPQQVIFSRWGGLVCGEIYADNNVTETVLASQDTLYQIAIFSANGKSRGMTPDYTNDHITTLTKGWYFVSISLSAFSAASNDYYFIANKNNGTIELNNLESRRQTTIAAKPGSVSISGIIDMNVGDTLELWIQRLDGGASSKSITIDHVTMSAILIGGWS